MNASYDADTTTLPVAWDPQVWVFTLEASHLLLQNLAIWADKESKLLAWWIVRESKLASIH